MKLKSIAYPLLGLVISGLALSCSREYIELKPQGTFLEDNYYENADQAYSGLVATYDIMGKQAKTFENMITMMNAGSDDFNAGGGSPSDGAGIVDKLGENVTKWKEGDKVTSVYTAEEWSDGPPVPGMDFGLGSEGHDGVLAEYIILNEERIARACDDG